MSSCIILQEALNGDEKEDDDDDDDDDDRGRLCLRVPHEGDC